MLFHKDDEVPTYHTHEEKLIAQLEAKLQEHSDTLDSHPMFFMGTLNTLYLQQVALDTLSQIVCLPLDEYARQQLVRVLEKQANEARQLIILLRDTYLEVYGNSDDEEAPSS